jgi:hypothetical protein
MGAGLGVGVALGRENAMRFLIRKGGLYLAGFSSLILARNQGRGPLMCWGVRLRAVALGKIFAAV